jgi:activator of 2-hydroxyglutaryl-CoA dehydratase
MLNTAAHEITHHVKNVAADKFKAFADAVFEEFGNRGQQVDALVEDRVQKMRGQKKYAEFTEAQLYDRAYEEVVADAAESMLTDSDALVKLANKIKAKDHSLWESVKNFINKLVKDIKRIYKDLSPNSFEGAFVRDMGDAAERLQKLWVEGVMAASEVDLTETVSEETMVGIDAGSESVSPVMLSERTWTASEYVTAREEMAKKIANALGVSVNKAKKYIDDVNSIAKLIANDRARLDYEASSFGSAFVSNVEYGGSFDYTTLCKKRRIYTGTFTEIQKKLRNTALTP